MRPGTVTARLHSGTMRSPRLRMNSGGLAGARRGRLTKIGSMPSDNCGRAPLRDHTTRSQNVVRKAMPTPAVTAIASAPQKATRMAPVVTLAPPARAARPPRAARNIRELPETKAIRYCSGARNATRNRHRRYSHGETGGRRQCSLKRPRLEILRDTEFVARMRSQRIMGHKLVGDLFGESRLNPAGHVDGGQFSCASPLSSALSSRRSTSS